MKEYIKLFIIKLKHLLFFNKVSCWFGKHYLTGNGWCLKCDKRL